MERFISECTRRLLFRERAHHRLLGRGEGCGGGVRAANESSQCHLLFFFVVLCYVVLCCSVFFCFVLFCFVLFCFVLFVVQCFALLCSTLLCFVRC